jgi:ethanolamine ammonia-lyase small subunit
MAHDSPPAPLRARAWLPEAPHAVRLACTALLVWIAARVGVTIILLYMGESPALNAGGSLALAAVTAAGVVLDERRRRGTLFYANMGVPPVWAGIIGAAVAGVLGIAASLIVGSGG